MEELLKLKSEVNSLMNEFPSHLKYYESFGLSIKLLLASEQRKTNELLDKIRIELTNKNQQL